MTEQTATLALPEPNVGFTSAAAFDLLQRAGMLLSKSTLVPEDFRGNVANCALAVNMALRLNADPVMIAQNLFVVHGRPSWSAAFLIATFNSCGRFTALKYMFQGLENTDSYGCYAYCTERATNELIKGETITIGMAKVEGWWGKKGSKWPSMAGQMLRYRAATFLIRATAPELALGLHTVDEMQDVYGADSPPRRAPVVVTSESITSGSVSGHDMASDERARLLGLLDAERARLGLDIAEWDAVVRDVVGDGPLEFADVTALSDLLAELKPMEAKA